MRIEIRSDGTIIIDIEQIPPLVATKFEIPALPAPDLSHLSMKRLADDLAEQAKDAINKEAESAYMQMCEQPSIDFSPPAPKPTVDELVESVRKGEAIRATDYVNNSKAIEEALKKPHKTPANFDQVVLNSCSVCGTKKPKHQILDGKCARKEYCLNNNILMEKLRQLYGANYFKVAHAGLKLNIENQTLRRHLFEMERQGIVKRVDTHNWRLVYASEAESDHSKDPPPSVGHNS